MISPVAERLLRDLDRREILLLQWLTTSPCVDRQKVLQGMRRQFHSWLKQPEYISPLSQKQWSWLLNSRLSYKRYEELLKKLK